MMMINCFYFVDVYDDWWLMFDTDNDDDYTMSDG